jgi:nitrate reductase cytochrome c-type subunit
MRKPIALLLVVMLMAAVGLAQIDPMLGSHNVNNAGCLSCHAPHNALPGKGAYLWAGAIPTGTYTTYLTSDGNGGTLNAGTMSAGLTNAMSSPVANLPMAHTVLCLSCHDTTFNTSMATAIPGSTTKTLNFNIGANENLSGDHPVDVQYPASNPTYFAAKVNATNYTVSFTDTAYAYGHPTKLYTDGTNAYVECSTCHNPHNQTAVVVPGAGGVLTAVCTTHFIRGQYRSTDEVVTTAPTVPCTPTKTTYITDNANFCMSCHSYPSNQFTGLPH